MKTILVEDEATTRKYLEEVLIGLGHEVRSCPDAETGLSLFREDPCPLVLIDWLMPSGQIDGLELCRTLREEEWPVRPYVLVVTVRDRTEDLVAALDAGADDYLPKPVDLEQLRIRLRIAEARIEEAVARAQAERALELSQARLETIVSNAPLVLFVVDKHGVFTHAEGRGLGALGLTPSDIVGQSVFELYSGEPDIAAHVSRALGGEEFTAEVEVRGITLESWYAPLRDDEGAIIVATDISERKKAQQRLFEGEERFRRFADAAFEGIVVIEDHRVVDANNQVAEMFGVTVEHVLGKPISDFVAEGERERASKYLAELRTDPFELTGVRRDGTEFPVEVRLRPFPYSGREVVVAAVQDVGHKRKAEDEHRKLEEQFRQAQKLESLGVLAGGIAHDFNNLLMGVLGNASLALMDLPPESEVTEHIHQIESAAQRAADLTNQMLAFSGKGKFVISRLNLSTFVDEISGFLRSSLSREVELQYRLDDDLPEIDADATQMRQVIGNLIANAADALGENPGFIRVSTGVRRVSRESLTGTNFAGELREGFQVYLEVRDTGSGMDEATLARIFDPFFTTKFTGRGLGMAAVLGIVRGHKGSIKVTSKPRQGTTVTVLFPPASPDEIIPPDADADVETAQPPTDLVLVVDDEETVRTVTAKMLERAGFHVIVAQNGMEAIEEYREHSDDITAVLLDLTMPDLNGDQVYQRFREVDPNTPVILMSGYDEKEATVQFSGQGLAGFIQKPFSTASLKEKIESVVNGRTT